jgi:hypothetical protein
MCGILKLGKTILFSWSCIAYDKEDIMQISLNIQPESTSKELKANRALLIVGFIVGTIGMFAFIIPQVLISPGSGDTEGAWLGGFTALCFGIPLFLLGLELFVVAAIKFRKEER